MSNKWKTFWALLNPRLRAEYSSDFEGAVAVVAAPFNCYLRNNPSDLSNRKIAEIAFQEMESGSPLSFIGQWEQCNILRRMDRLNRKTIHGYPGSCGVGERITTYEIVKWISEKVISLSGQSSKVVLVGHPHHVRRVKILLEYFGVEVLVSGLSDQVPYDPEHDSPARHWWTLSVWRYIPWEYLSRLHHARKIALGLW